MQTHCIEIHGLTQRFHVAGSGPICIVHSGGPGIGWEYLRMPLLELSLTLIYVEPIGTGFSGQLSDPRGYTIGRYSRQLIGILDHLRLSRAHVLGHSYGGFVAQRLALDHPDRVASLVLYATSPVTGPEFLADARANIARIAKRSGDDQLCASFDAIWTSGDDATFTRHFRAIFPAYFAEYQARAAEFEPLRSALVASWDPMRGESPDGPFDTRSALGKLRIPTLVTTGRHDYICGPRWAELLVRGVPGAASLTFERSGHMSHLEEAEDFARAIADFVSRCPS
ncbi:MAG TPA: alpha/beta hydrolase [Polyangiaceae bacterium]|nr:alpha/beta hydrolase [Polyangiaceae bacterium]